MPAFNFQQRFAELVRDGRKCQTIRACRKDGRVPKIGAPFIAYTGMRTKHCRILRAAMITEVLPIEISTAGITLNGRLLEMPAAHRLAVLDGFSSANEMIGWFIAMHGRSTFVGHVIRWL